MSALFSLVVYRMHGRRRRQGFRCLVVQPRWSGVTTWHGMESGMALFCGLHRRLNIFPESIITSCYVLVRVVSMSEVYSTSHEFEDRSGTHSVLISSLPFSLFSRFFSSTAQSILTPPPLVLHVHFCTTQSSQSVLSLAYLSQFPAAHSTNSCISLRNQPLHQTGHSSAAASLWNPRSEQQHAISRLTILPSARRFSISIHF